MRVRFSELMFDLMKEDDRVFFLTGDLGFKVWDKVRESFPDRAFNVGAAEQLLVGAGVGLALSGKIPVCYSITPFLLYRPFELIRNYVNHESIPVKLIGSGRDKDYAHDGFSHWAEDDKAIMSNFPHIRNFHPKDEADLERRFRELILTNWPCYINLKR